MSKDWVCLIQLKTSEGFRSHLIEKPSFVLGRSQETDLPLLDSSISRAHLAVQFKRDKIFIIDQGSANGTFLNGNRLDPNQPIEIAPDDVVKLGTGTYALKFLTFPRPVELMDTELRQGVMLDELAKRLDEGARVKVEAEVKEVRERADRELQRAQAELKKARELGQKEVFLAKEDAAKIIDKAGKDAEALRIHELLALNSRKKELELEINKLSEEARTLVARELARGTKEAEHLVHEAQKKVQQEYSDSTSRIEQQLREFQKNSAQVTEEAQARAHRIVSEAQAEADRIRLEINEEARVIQQNALKKGAEKLAEIQAEQRESLLAQQRAHDERMSVARDDFNRLRDEKSKMDREFELVKEEFGEARRLLAQVEDLEARRDKAEVDFKDFERSREEGVGDLQRELKEMRDQAMIQFGERKREQENELVKARLKSIEDTRAMIKSEEVKYDEIKRLRSVELTQRIYDRLVPQLSSLMQDPDSAPGKLRIQLEASVNEVLVHGHTSLQPVVSEMPPVVQVRDNRMKGVLKVATIVAVACISVAVFYGRESMVFLQSLQKDAAKHIVEQRRIQSIYTPEQSDKFYESYTDNVLHMRGYYETKVDPRYREKWTLRLNNLKFLRPMGLSEENVVLFIAKETNLVLRLGSLRNSIDAIYLKESMARMRAAEEEDLADIRRVLKSDENLRKIRKVEREFLVEYMSEQRKN